VIVTKGKRWEILHSLWIGWTFTLGFFNWIAFLYIGFRTKQLKWILWALFYSVPFVLAMFYAAPDRWGTWLGSLTIVLTFVLGVVSIFHAFMVRKEYLLRLQGTRRRAAERDKELANRLSEEYGEGLAETPPTATTSSPSVAPRSSTTELSDAKEQMTTAPSRVDQTSNIAQSGDELDYQISSSYPFPIAYGFRSLMSVVDPRDLYREQLRIAENILAFLASISLALKKTGPPNSQHRPWRVLAECAQW
jgi:hypothetical protein